MTLSDLTQEQVFLLNQIWEFESLQQLINWQFTLPLHQAKQVDVLVMLLKMEQMEENMDPMMISAKTAIAKAFYKNKNR
jgi:hypothetical protein